MWGKSGLGIDNGQDLQNQYYVTKLDNSLFSETRILDKIKYYYLLNISQNSNNIYSIKREAILINLLIKVVCTLSFCYVLV